MRASCSPRWRRRSSTRVGISEARTSLEQALPIFTASGYKYRQAAAIGNLGTIVVMEGEFGTARRLLMEGLRLSHGGPRR